MIEDVDPEAPRPEGHYQIARGAEWHYVTDGLAETVSLGPATIGSSRSRLKIGSKIKTNYLDAHGHSFGGLNWCVPFFLTPVGVSHPFSTSAHFLLLRVSSAALRAACGHPSW